MWKRVSSEFRSVFGVDEKAHLGHMMAVEQSVLDGTSKWSAKIAITGLWPARARRFLNWSCALSVSHATSVSSVWCSSRYMIHICAAYAYIFLICIYSASHRYLHILCLYIMRVRTRLLWLLLPFIIIIVIIIAITLRSGNGILITGSWWLPRVWLYCIDCAMNVSILSNKYHFM